MNIALVILLATLPNIWAEQKFVIEPEDVSAVLGTHITLPCRVNSKHGVLQWTKDDFGLGTHRNLSAFDRYSMIGNDDDGDYSLKIESVHLEDDAKFQCQVSPGPEGKNFIRFVISDLFNLLDKNAEANLINCLFCLQVNPAFDRNSRH